jgi:cation-transporting P-type ATPase C
VGNKKLLENYKVSVKDFEKETNTHLNNGHSVVYVAVDKELLGYLVLEHEVRAGTKKMIDDLRNKGVKHIALLTGDEEKVANSFALNFGFDTVYANQSPYDKAKAIEDLKSKYKNVVMVGDGVNDTLAMSKADVAISFAAGGSKAAIEVSDIAVTHSHPEDVVNLYELSCKTLDVVNQNYWLGTGTNLGGVAFASVGMLSPVAAGAIHIGHTVGIMANSSRLALSDNKS